MAHDQKLADLRAKEQGLFSQKQDAYAALQTARAQTDEAYKHLVSVRSVLYQKRSAMNEAFGEAKTARDEAERIWGEYRRVKDANSLAIDAARREANEAHQEMVRCFASASQEYQSGNKSMARSLFLEGHDYKDRRNTLNEDVKRLAQEIKDARTYAEIHAPRVDWTRYKALKAEFDTAKAEKERLEKGFRTLKAERERLKAEFDRLKAAHQAARDAVTARRNELEAERARTREQTLAKAGVPLSERGDAKVVEKPDGTTHVYHGGIGKGDGAGHGHTVLDRSGEVAYDRAAFAEHGGQNFTDGEKTGWTRAERGVILGDTKDYPVTFVQGTGANSGQTLIADGHVSKRELHTHHSHYGLNDKSRYPDQPTFVEDSDKHRNDDAYTGPGH